MIRAWAHYRWCGALLAGGARTRGGGAADQIWAAGQFALLWLVGAAPFVPQAGKLSHFVGVLLMIVGGALIGGSALNDGRKDELKTDGTFRLSRNPLSGGLVIACVGLSIFSASSASSSPLTCCRCLACSASFSALSASVRSASAAAALLSSAASFELASLSSLACFFSLAWRGIRGAQSRVREEEEERKRRARGKAHACPKEPPALP